MSNVPTLFDLDDLFPEETGNVTLSAKGKTGRKAPGKQEEEQTVPEAKNDEQEPGTTETEGVVHREPEAGTEQPLAAAPDRIAEQNVRPRLELPGKEALSGALTGSGDGDLDKQFLQELAAAAPYAESKYPFDPASVEVIDKEKKSKPKAPIAFSKKAGDTGEPGNEKTEDARSLPEWDLNKTYYSIGEVAQLFGVNISHIRFWTTEFKMKPRTTRKGDRLYTPDQIAQLRLIYHLVKEKKHTLKGAREMLRSGKESVAGHLDLKESLTQLRDMLVEIRENL